MKIYDSHTHLNNPQLFWDYKKYIQNFQDIWGVALVNVWADHEYNQNAIHISKNNSSKVEILSVIWLHPYEIVERWNKKKLSKEFVDKNFKICKDLILDNIEFVHWIWESGIDLHYDGAEKNIKLQKHLFKLHCNLAQKLSLPLVIHSRDAFEETFDVLKDFPKLKIYFHCRGYSELEIQKLEQNFENLRIGFCGNISYPRADNLRSSLRAIKNSKLLIETDAPYLNIQELRWKQNEPANIKYTYEYIAKRLKTDLEELSNTIEKNFLNLYSKK